MKVKDNKIIEITEQELFELYLKRKMDDLYSFYEYKHRMEEAGTRITEQYSKNKA